MVIVDQRLSPLLYQTQIAVLLPLKASAYNQHQQLPLQVRHLRVNKIQCPLPIPEAQVEAGLTAGILERHPIHLPQHRRIQ